MDASEAGDYIAKNWLPAPGHHPRLAASAEYRKVTVATTQVWGHVDRPQGSGRHGHSAAGVKIRSPGQLQKPAHSLFRGCGLVALDHLPS